ncbi:MAG: hypothetical protein WKG06_16600 [Segetibacter sp.]
MKAPVLSIAIDSNGDKWFGTNGWGISKFDGIYWTTYTEANNSSIAEVNAIAIDTKGNKWFGTGKGLLQLKSRN